MPARIHGLCKTRLYHIWRGMIARCYRSHNVGYRRYGARGIGICPQWRNDFMDFRSWALATGYAEHLTIDRKDNDGNYEPENCRWVTRTEQQRNRCNSDLVTLNGQTLPLRAWAVELGIPESTLWWRHRKLGKSDQETLTVGRLKPPKLSADHCKEIRRRREAGEMLEFVARDFCCSKATISRVMHGTGRYAAIWSGAEVSSGYNDL